MFKDPYGNVDDGVVRRQKALEKMEELSLDEKQKLYDRSKEITHEEALKMPTDDYLLMSVLCDKISEVYMLSLGDSEIETLKDTIFGKLKDQTITEYEFSIFGHLCHEWGPMEIPAKYKK